MTAGLAGKSSDVARVPPPRRTRTGAIAAALLAVVLGLGAVTADVAPVAANPDAGLQFAQGAIQVATDATVGETRRVGLSVRSTGTASLEISGVTATGDFAVPDLGDCADPVQPGADCTLVIEYTPRTPGVFQRGTIEVSDNTLDGRHSLPVFGSTEPGEPGFQVAPLTFGVHPLGTTTTRRLTLTNSGVASIYLLDARLPSDDGTPDPQLAVSGTSCRDVVLTPRDTCWVDVTFAPTTEGYRRNAILFETSLGGLGPDNGNVSGIGGDAAVRRSELTVPTAPVVLPDAAVGGAVTTGEVTFTNSGTEPIWLSEPAFSGDFVLARRSGCDLTRPSTSCTLRVEFRPTATGPRTGTVTYLDDTPQGSHTVTLTANGLDPGPIPTITALSPNQGLGRANTLVTATGANLGAVTITTVNGTAVPYALAPDASSLSFRVPSTNQPGDAQVRVSTATGVSATATFTYLPAPPPVIRSITPDHVYDDGSSLVRVVGTDLDPTAILADGHRLDFTVSPDQRVVTFRAPARVGATDTFSFTVYTHSGSTFGYLTTVPTPPPTLTGITPNHGPERGGTAVRLTGTNLINTTSITVEGRPIPVADYDSNPAGTVLTFRMPPHVAGTVPMVATTPTGSATLTYTYDPPPAPTITGIAPGNGPAKGNTTVRITGTGLTGATVTIAGQPATPTVNTAGTALTVRTPAHAAGTVPVVVTTPAGTATTNYTFDPVPAPTITGVVPGNGPIKGGTAIRITGTDLLGATVTVGGQQVAPTVNAAGTAITFRTPAHAAGPVPVVVTTATGTARGTFTYDPPPAPTITSVSPTSGPVRGGTTVRLGGTDLIGASVTIGGRAVAVTVNAAGTAATITTPARAAGTVPIVVTTPSGRATTTYTYR